MTEHELKQRASSIRLVLSDVDGVLTDGGVYYGAEGELMKRFHIRDGMGVELLRESGIEVGFITGEGSPSVSSRAEKLRITRVHLLAKDKPAILRDIIANDGFTFEEIAYIGDDVNDLEAMKLVGLSAAPIDATLEVREIAHYVCRNAGGGGAFREFADFILSAKKELSTETRLGFR